MGASVSVLPWPPDKAREYRAMARNVMLHDAFHNRGHDGHNNDITRENCGPCVLAGFVPSSGYDDGYDVNRDGPNYAGWARLYVEAGHPVPAKWRDAFERERASDNRAYAHALERSIVTFGVTFA